VNPLYKQSATDVVAMLRSGELSPAEALESAIMRIEEVDSKINALPIRCFERALDVAHKINMRKHRANPRSLCGLPIAVKDYNDVAGVRTTYGSPIYKNNIALCSDVTIQMLEENGANPIAKSNVPEWAGGHTFNPIYGLTRNPWNLSRSAGGSSGGSAAALASGQIWLATGNDLGGSLRTPAAFNAIVGLRPSPGVVPRGQSYQTFDTLWVEGPMGRSVADVALMLDAQCGQRIEDPLSSAHNCRSFQRAVQNPLRPHRIAFSADLGIVPVCKTVRSIVGAAISQFSQLGIDISDEIPDFSGILDSFHTLRGVLLATLKGDLLKKYQGSISSDIVKNIEAGFSVTAEQLVEAEKKRWALSTQMSNFFVHHDFLICPTTSVMPFESNQPFVKEIDGVPCKTYIDWFAITFALTMTGCPVISIPCGFTEDNLPVGLQILGQPHREDELLRFAKFLEDCLGITRRLPIDPKHNI